MPRYMSAYPHESRTSFLYGLEKLLINNTVKRENLSKLHDRRRKIYRKLNKISKDFYIAGPLSHVTFCKYIGSIHALNPAVGNNLYEKILRTPTLRRKIEKFSTKHINSYPTELNRLMLKYNCKNTKEFFSHIKKDPYKQKEYDQAMDLLIC